jgi:hypothetical protein
MTHNDVRQTAAHGWGANRVGLDAEVAMFIQDVSLIERLS